jgi:hypothetical protein
MRKYRLHDTTRGLMTVAAVAIAGLLLWLATRVGQETTGRFWASMGIVAGAGVGFALLQAIGGWTKGLRLRISLGTVLLGFVPSLVLVGWILLATQPGSGWHEGRFASWSSSIGVLDVVHDLGLWHGVLAFGLGIVFGLSLDVVPAAGEVVVLDEATPAKNDVVVVDDEPTAVRDRWVADEPLAAERDAALAAEPHTVVVGPVDDDR